MKALLALALLALSADADEASLTYESLQRVINDAGQRCDQAVNYRAARFAGAEHHIRMIVDCSDGSSHVLEMSIEHGIPHDLRYYENCHAWWNPWRCE